MVEGNLKDCKYFYFSNSLTQNVSFDDLSNQGSFVGR